MDSVALLPLLGWPTGQCAKGDLLLLTSGERGGVLGPKDLCTKTGTPVIEVLRAKHPDQHIPDLQDPRRTLPSLSTPRSLTPFPLTVTQSLWRVWRKSSLEQRDAAELTRHYSRAASSAMVRPHQTSGRSCWNGLCGSPTLPLLERPTGQCAKGDLLLLTRTPG